MDGDASEAAPEPSPRAGESSADPWLLITLAPNDGQEPPASQSDAEADAVWAAVSALWHPALLADASSLPRTEDLDSPSSALPREARVVPKGFGNRLPSGYRTAAADIGAVLIDDLTDRFAIARAVLARIQPNHPPLDDQDPIVLDFFAARSTFVGSSRT